MRKLTDEQIKQKLAEGHNYKRLYQEIKARFDKERAEKRQLEAELVALKALFNETVESQQARIEELEIMVFGRKPHGGLKYKIKTGVVKKPSSWLVKEKYFWTVD